DEHLARHLEGDRRAEPGYALSGRRHRRARRQRRAERHGLPKRRGWRAGGGAGDVGAAHSTSSPTAHRFGRGGPVPRWVGAGNRGQLSRRGAVEGWLMRDGGAAEGLVRPSEAYVIEREGTEALRSRK